jgi:hypothetical protein
LGVLTPWFICHQKCVCKPVLMLGQSTPRSRLPKGVFITGELGLPGVFMIGESFWTLGSHFTNFREHATILKGFVILKIDSRLFYIRVPWDILFMFEKIA